MSTVAQLPYTMNILGENSRGLPPWLVHAVRTVKQFAGFFSENSLAGVPLDWVVGFVVAGFVITLLTWKMRARRAAILVTALLLATEAIEVFAVLNIWRPRLPDLGDATDVAAGVLGIVAAALIGRWRRPNSHAKGTS